MVPWDTHLRGALTRPDEAPSFGTRLRAQRFEMFLRRFPSIGDMRVLDLGGTVTHWMHHDARPASVVVLNIDDQQTDLDWVTVVHGDACDPPAAVTRERFDLVYSNSVIEHVGGHARRFQFAEVAQERASAHWIQTPYRYFPIEPHWIFPGLQFLPTAARARLAPLWPLAPAHPTGRQAVGDVLEIELLSKTEFSFYFPESVIVKETFAGLTKSLIATAGA